MKRLHVQPHYHICFPTRIHPFHNHYHFIKTRGWKVVGMENGYYLQPFSKHWSCNKNPTLLQPLFFLHIQLKTMMGSHWNLIVFYPLISKMINLEKSWILVRYENEWISIGKKRMHERWILVRYENEWIWIGKKIMHDTWILVRYENEWISVREKKIMTVG